MLVGRDPELSELRALIGRARTGRGGTAVVVAEAGGGKTRLAEAARAMALDTGMTVLWGAGTEATAGVPLLPVAQAINNALSAVDVQTVRARLGRAHGLAALVTPELFPDQPPPATVEDLLKPALFEALLAVARALGGEPGVLLVLEDVQWADITTRQLAVHFAIRAPNLALALVITWRDGDDDRALTALTRSTSATVVRPGALTDADLERLGRNVMGKPPRPDLVAAVGERSGGNPFAAFELFVAFQRSGLGEGVPRNVRDAILGRTRALGAKEDSVLRAASVFDRDFDVAELAEVSGLPARALPPILRRLAANGLFEDARRGRHRFRHALIATAIRSEIDDLTLRALHSCAADVLRGSGAPDAERAHHLFAAGRPDEAAAIATDAASAAELHGSNLEASVLFERAAGGTADGGDAGELLGRAAWTALLGLQPERARELALQSMAMLREAGRSAGRVRSTLGGALLRLGEVDAGRVEWLGAVADLEAGGPSADLGHALMIAGANEMGQWRPEETMTLGERAVAVAAEVGDTRTLMPARGLLITALAMFGKYEEAIPAGDELVEEAIAAEYYTPALAGLNNTSVFRLVALRGREALVRLESCFNAERLGPLAIQRFRIEAPVLAAVGEPRAALTAVDRVTMASPIERGRVALAQALALLQLDRAGEALQVIEAQPTDPGVRHTRAGVEALARLAAGDHEGALVVAREQAGLSQLDFRAWARWAEPMVEVLLACGAGDEAESAAHNRRAEADSGYPYWQLIRARLALQGEPALAAAEGRAAATRFGEAGYAWDDGRARLVLAEALVASNDSSGAVVELHRTLETAKHHGIAFHVRLARQRLGELGDPADALSADLVRRALEELDQGPAELRSRLVDLVNELVAAGGREGEAGTILRDYYVKKVGSQEVVAERHYLTRATFYRRLHLGWELLASRLGPLDGAPTGSARKS